MNILDVILNILKIYITGNCLNTLKSTYPDISKEEIINTLLNKLNQTI